MGGQQKCIVVDEDRMLLPFFDKRMSQEVAADSLGDEFKGYRFRISGGNDKQGFPMMQGVLSNDRVRLLLKKGSKCYRQRRPGRLGPKRVNKIRKLFNLESKDDVRRFVVRRVVTTKGGKTYKKAPKIQRLITPQQLQRKRHRVALKRGRAEKNKKEQASYKALVMQRAKEAKERRQELLQKRRSSHGSSHSASAQ